MTQQEEDDYEMREEYDFSNALKSPYAERARRGTNLILIEPELFERFPSAEAVNEALRSVLKARETETHAKAS